MALKNGIAPSPKVLTSLLANQKKFTFRRKIKKYFPVEITRKVKGRMGTGVQEKKLYHTCWLHGHVTAVVSQSPVLGGWGFLLA